MTVVCVDGVAGMVFVQVQNGAGLWVNVVVAQVRGE